MSTGDGSHVLVDWHFAADASRSWSGAGDARLFRHLRRCDGCRARYRAHALLEALAPDGEGRARDRLARGVFADRRRGWRERLRTRFGLAGLGLALAAGAAALVLVAGPPPSEQFRARGGAGAGPAPSLLLHRVAGGITERAGAVIAAGEALVFSYVNPPGEHARTHLMVFAHDDRRRVFWFWPAWQDATTNPTAVAIDRSEAPVELGEAVRHQLAPGPLTVVGLFADRPLTVRQVEAAVASGDPGALSSFAQHLWTERVEVLP